VDSSMGFFELQNKAKNMDLSTLLDLQRVVESELERRGETCTFQAPASGVLLGQGIYTIGEHIPAGTYAFHLPKFISRDASNSSYLYIFDNAEEYQQHLDKNNGNLGTIPTFFVYRNSPISCLTLTAGQILAIKYNGAIISKFKPEL